MQILLDLFMKFTVDFSFLNSLLFTDPNTTGINYSNGWWGGVGAGGGGGSGWGLSNCHQSIRLNNQNNLLLLLLLELP